MPLLSARDLCCVKCVHKGNLQQAAHFHHIFRDGKKFALVPLCVSCHKEITAINTLCARMKGQFVPGKYQSVPDIERGFIFWLFCKSPAKGDYERKKFVADLNKAIPNVPLEKLEQVAEQLEEEFVSAFYRVEQRMSVQ